MQQSASTKLTRLDLVSVFNMRMYAHIPYSCLDLSQALERSAHRIASFSDGHVADPQMPASHLQHVALWLAAKNSP